MDYGLVGCWPGSRCETDRVVDKSAGFRGTVGSTRGGWSSNICLVSKLDIGVYPSKRGSGDDLRDGVAEKVLARGRSCRSRCQGH